MIASFDLGMSDSWIVDEDPLVVVVVVVAVVVGVEGVESVSNVESSALGVWMWDMGTWVG